MNDNINLLEVLPTEFSDCVVQKIEPIEKLENKNIEVWFKVFLKGKYISEFDLEEIEMRKDTLNEEIEKKQDEYKFDGRADGWIIYYLFVEDWKMWIKIKYFVDVYEDENIYNIYEIIRKFIFIIKTND